MNEFIKEMTKRAASCPCIIGFPEADNVDILKTAEQMKVLLQNLQGNMPFLQKVFSFLIIRMRKTDRNWQRNM